MELYVFICGIAHTSDHVLLQHSHDNDTKSLAGATVTPPYDFMWHGERIALVL